MGGNAIAYHMTSTPFGWFILLSAFVMAANLDRSTPDTTVDVIDYYDIMIIGRTGMGKSTTSDKLIIANPDGYNYRGEQHPDQEIGNEGQTQMSDLSVWLVPEGAKDEVERYLKDLIMARSLEDPHKQVIEKYKESNTATTRCQVFSNETTKIRVLDVPGFFGEDLSGNPKQDTANKVTITGVRIMREILRIQALLRMHFKRVIYFIPERGPLERPHKVLQMELEQMLHYFGKAIFDCMVLIATQAASVYRYIPKNQIPWSDDDHTTTRDNFMITLGRALSEDVGSDNAIPPIVFISILDSCEDVMKKIKDAPVISQQLTIPFECQACSRCGLKAKWLRNKENEKVKIACYAGEDPSLSIPYEESRCHPMIVPKYYEITKIIGGVAHVITRRKYIGKWPDFHNEDDEVCIACNQIPGTQGCERVKTDYVYKNLFLYFVDHKGDPNEPIFIEGEDPDEHRQLHRAEDKTFDVVQQDIDPDQGEATATSGDQSPEPEHREITAIIESQQLADSPANVGEAAYHNVTSDVDVEVDED